MSGKTHGLNLDVKDTKPRKSTVNLSVFTYPYTWKTWYGFWRNIKSFFDNLKGAWQRAKWGYCYGDVYNCGAHIVDHTIAMLTEFRNKTNSWPDYEFDSLEDWIAYIDKIIDKLEASRCDRDKINDYYADFEKYLNMNPEEKAKNAQISESYYAEDAVLYQYQKTCRIEAFTMLVPYLDTIWW